MTFRDAHLEIDAAVRDNLTETGGLVELKEQCEKEPEFAAKLANAFGWTVQRLLEFIDESISEIRAHHVRMERRSRRSCRW